MAHVIAVAGKGGVGKTTLCGMLIQYLCEKGKGPVLAVDADANSNLNEVLGVKVETTLGDVREEIARAEMAKDNPIPAGMSKADYMELRFEDALVEDRDFDLLVMGKDIDTGETETREEPGKSGIGFTGFFGMQLADVTLQPMKPQECLRPGVKHWLSWQSLQWPLERQVQELLTAFLNRTTVKRPS